MFIGFDSQEKQLLSERHIGKRHWAGVFHMSFIAELDMRLSPELYTCRASGAAHLKRRRSAHTGINNIHPNNRS